MFHVQCFMMRPMTNTNSPKEPNHPIGGDFIRDIVFGANDGVVTSIGFLVGLTGAVPEPKILVIGGILTIVAGSASMALGNYIGTKSEKEYYDAQRRNEEWEIDNKREDEIQEIRDIYKGYGFNDEDVEKLTQHIIADRKLWVDVMMREELGLQPVGAKAPLIAAVVMGVTFLAGGIPPLLPYLFVGSVFPNVNAALFASVAISLLVMVAIGITRSFLNQSGYKKMITETVVIGIIATLIGFFAGQFIAALGISAIR